MTRNGVRTASVLAGMVFGGMSLAAQAVTLDFYCITNNNPGDCAIGEAQLAVEVSAVGTDQVLFYFTNASGGFASSIARVYFDDGTLLGIASIDNSSSGVSFSQGANPGELPGANNATPPFVTSVDFLADSDPPVQPNGVNPGEYLGILFDLQLNGTYDDVLAELTDGRLRIGLHVIGFSSDGSEGFVNNPIPVPAAIWLLGSGLLGLGAIGRRRKA